MGYVPLMQIERRIAAVKLEDLEAGEELQKAAKTLGLGISDERIRRYWAEAVGEALQKLPDEQRGRLLEELLQGARLTDCVQEPNNDGHLQPDGAA